MANINAKVILKGGLNWYNKNKITEIYISHSGKKLNSVLEEYNVPLEQVQFATVNGKMVKDNEYAIKDGDEIKVIPIIEGG